MEQVKRPQVAKVSTPRPMAGYREIYERDRDGHWRMIRREPVYKDEKPRDVMNPAPIYWEYPAPAQRVASYGRMQCYGGQCATCR